MSHKWHALALMLAPQPQRHIFVPGPVVWLAQMSFGESAAGLVAKSPNATWTVQVDG